MAVTKLETTPPSPLSYLKLSLPADRVLLVTMNRPKDLNCINSQGSREMDEVFKWFDAEPNLSVAVLTGAGRAFCAGADLKEWNESMKPKLDPKTPSPPQPKPFSRRLGKKPVIAAVNGLAMGGGTEFAVNCDLVFASEKAVFALPEVKRGVSPFAGVLPRLIRIVGLQRASEFALTGRDLSAQEAFTWGLVNGVVPTGQDVVDEAVRWASMIAANSPDSIICTRAGLRQGWESASVEEAAEITQTREFAALTKGENIKEGLQAFVEKRKPVWKASLL